MLIALVISKLLLSFGKTQREREKERKLERDKERERERAFFGDVQKLLGSEKVSGQYTGRCFAYVNEISLKWKNKQTKK